MPDSPTDSAADFLPEHEFDAKMEIDAENGGVYIVMPFNVEEQYGVRGVLPVRVTFDGFPYQTTLSPLGEGEHGMVVPKPVRGAINKTWGEVVHVRLAYDKAPRQITPPDDLAHALLTAPGAREKFSKLTYSQQRDYVRWVEAAKNVDTRRRRIEETVSMVLAGRKRS
jgi:Bacteriocin-protection, YdeI or OmpD-Associated/Domain of unknown function (DUF1905)